MSDRLRHNWGVCGGCLLHHLAVCDEGCDRLSCVGLFLPNVWERLNRSVCGGDRHLYVSRLFVVVMAIASSHHAALSVDGDPRESSRHNNGDGDIQVSKIGVDGHPSALGNNQESQDVDLVDNEDRHMDICRGNVHEVTETETVNAKRVPGYQAL